MTQSNAIATRDFLGSAAKKKELSELADIHLEIPMSGVKQSLNVSVAAGIIGYELLRKYKLKNL